MASTSKQNQQATSLGKGNRSSSERSPKSPENNPKSKRSKGSMGLGLILIAISTSLVGLGGLGYFIYQELLNSSKREIATLAEARSSQIESRVNSVQNSVNAVAVRAAAVALPKQRTAAMYQKLLVEALQNSEPSAAMGILGNSNLLTPNSKPFTAYIFKKQSGLSPETKAKDLPAPNDTLLSTTFADTQKLPWSKSAQDGNATWTDSYSFSGQNIATYSAAIKENNKTVGVISGDVVVSSLLANASEDKSGFVVIGANGKLITSSNSFQTAQSQNPAISETLNTLLQQSRSNPNGITQTAGNLWAYRQVAGSKWVVATYVPESEIIGKLVIPLGASAIAISSILVIAILGFTNSLKKRLRPITEECEQFLAQQGNNSGASGKDDIENLSISLKTTLQQVKHNEIRLRNELTQTATTDGASSQAQQQMQQNSAENELIEAEVGDLLDIVSSMEEGDLTIEAQVNDRATGLVADTLNRLREKLVEIISSVLGTAQQVAKGASDLEELARTVVLNTAEQAQSVAQGQALTEQVAMIAQRSASQVGIANYSLQEVRETVASGQTAIDTLTDSISVLQSGSAQIVQRIKTLGEFVGLAEQFVQDQGQIASLTQVLALNATLVAARAAEQKDPKQFAGVAREFEAIAGQVNELATQTNEGLTVLQQRTSQIQTVVTAIDAEVQSLSGLVSGFTTGVASSQSAFQNIQVVTEGVVQIGQTITESSTEIAEAAGSTATYISEIAQLAERTASLTRSARQQAESMGNQAQQLLQEIQFFRLPEKSDAPADTSPVMDAPIVQTKVVAPDTSESLGNSALGLVAVPAVAIAAATALSAFQSNDQPEASTANGITEELVDDEQVTDLDLDDYLLEPDDEDIEDIAVNANLVAQSEQPDEQQDYPSVGFSDDLESLDELVEDPEQLYVFDEPEDLVEINELEPDPQVQEDAYAGTTDIAMIEESLFADLKQELYQDDYDDYLDELVIEEDHGSLKNPLDGVDEMAISEAATDPMILSAADSFMEDTTFGTPSALSDETLANLPDNVDFNIPDLDSDNDFEISSDLIESSLDDSNSFFDASFATGLEQIDPVGIQLNTESEDYQDYVQDEALNESLDDAFGNASSEVLNNSFGASFDESPFDRAFDEAINDYQSDPFDLVSEDLPEGAAAEFADGFADELVEENPDDFAFDQTFDQAFDQYSGEELASVDDTFDAPQMEAFSNEMTEISEISELEAFELEAPTLDMETLEVETLDNSPTAFPALFSSNILDDDSDDLVMPDFSITDDQLEFGVVADGFEAIPTENVLTNVLTDEMFSFDLSEEGDAFSDDSAFEMGLSTDEDQEETANNLVAFEQISESPELDLSFDLSELDSATDDLEESAIFGIAYSDLDLGTENFDQDVVDDLSSFYGIDPMAVSESEAVEEGEADAMFGDDDLLMDYPDLDQPSLETSQDYSAGFADELLDSLMSEGEFDQSNDFLMGISDDLPDFSDDSANDMYADPFASPVGSTELGDSNELEDSNFSFDFSAFEDLDDDHVADKPSKAIVDARSEIDSFLSDTFPDSETKLRNPDIAI